MTVEQVKQYITEQGWTPQEKPRGGKLYLYAARKAKQSRRVQWKYIGPLSKIESLTEEDVLEKLVVS